MVSLVGVTLNSHAALTATTANVIEGRAPLFKAVSGENKLGFTLQGTYYSEGAGNISAGTAKEFNADLRLSDFAIKQLVAGDFTVSSDYADIDGDGAATVPFTMGTVSYEWRQSNGTLINAKDYSKILGCGSGFSLPLTLKITLPNVQVHSEYGLPKDSAATTLTKSYKITTASGMCFAKPYQMEKDTSNTWRGWNGSSWEWNNGSSSASASGGKGGGYSSDFDPANGFKVGAATKFPTTGFAKAKFKLIMIGSQTDYNYSVTASPSGSVSVDTNGYVTLNSKPNGNVTVTAELKADTSVKHHYVFNPTTVWAVPKLGSYRWDTNAAQNQCGGATKVLTRAELTNSPYNTGDHSTGWTFIRNYYTRAIDGTLLSEWGWVDDSFYPGSQWVTEFYWTQDAFSFEGEFNVTCATGQIGHARMYVSYPVVCRG